MLLREMLPFLIALAVWDGCRLLLLRVMANMSGKRLQQLAADAAREQLAARGRKVHWDPYGAGLAWCSGTQPAPPDTATPRIEDVVGCGPCEELARSAPARAAAMRQRSSS